MSKEPCLLNQIRSKYILQKIFSFAFKDTKSVFKFIKYDKNLINKLEINFKENFEYKTKIKLHLDETEIIMTSTLILVYEIILFIFYLIYMILFYTKIKFKEHFLI